MGCKEALCELEDTDPDFKSINFIKEDWDEAALMYNCFKVLEDLSQELSNLLNCKYNTAKVDFPMFCDIFLKLVQLGKSDNHYFCFLVSRFRKYFDEFWNKSKLVLVITGILDPQFKMSFNVENFYKEMYGNDAKARFYRIVDYVANIFNQYAKGTNNSMSSSSQESELNCYLSDPKCPSEEGFDILQWWHFNSSTYPILARMARDFLSIPISATDEDDSLVKEIKCVYDCLDNDFKLKFAYTKIWFDNLENN
ncbi:hypothetical protein Pint_25854 [Pistacia integerrima]|uniref:Uncharacterized protein n=1 Tax=Pistacia integerrima TaxID=434235 RepID=A0ACC0YDS3_9ROSI|nr:hypothetical protein Pint_25854 [Pistacia integerrima]